MDNTGSKSIEKEVEKVFNQLFDFKEEPVEHLGSKAINPKLLELLAQDLEHVKFVGKFIQSKLYIKPYLFLPLLHLMKDFVSHVEDRTEVVRDNFTQDLLRDVLLFETFLKENPDIRSAGYLQQHYRSINPFEKKVDFRCFRKRNPIKMNHSVVNKFFAEKERDGVSELTIVHYEYSIRTFFCWLISTHRDFEAFALDQFPIHMLTSEHLQEYERYLALKVQRKQLSKKTVSDTVYELHSFLSTLFQKRRITTDVTKGLNPVTKPSYRYRDIPSVKEIKEFFRVIEVYSNEPIRDKFIYGCMLLMGFRLAEVVTLSWESINLSSNTVSFVRKYKKAAKMYLPKVLKRYLTELQSIDPDAPLIKKSGAYEQIYLNYKIYALLAAWEYPGGVHLLRHTFLTHLSYSNDPKLLMKVGGFNRLETVSNYIHRHTNQLKQAINKLDTDE